MIHAEPSSHDTSGSGSYGVRTRTNRSCRVRQRPASHADAKRGGLSGHRALHGAGNGTRTRDVQLGCCWLLSAGARSTKTAPICNLRRRCSTGAGPRSRDGDLVDRQRLAVLVDRAARIVSGSRALEAGGDRLQVDRAAARTRPWRVRPRESRSRATVVRRAHHLRSSAGARVHGGGNPTDRLRGGDRGDYARSIASAELGCSVSRDGSGRAAPSGDVEARCRERAARSSPTPAAVTAAVIPGCSAADV